MNFDDALNLILSNLKENKGATNRSLIELIDEDHALFEKVREHLIFNDLAEDKKGVGLVFLGPTDTEVSFPEKDEMEKSSDEPSTAGSPAAPHRLFISYGRKDCTELANRIAADLTGMGHDVWLDKQQIMAGRSWEEQIEEAILDHDIFISLLTPHAVRKPNGVCLDEISMARFHNRKIIPAMVVQCRPPLTIYRLDWVDFTEWTNENNYKRSFSRIIKAFGDKESFEGVYADIFSKLKPLDFGVDVSRMTKDFTGRKWLFDEIDSWLKNSPGKVFIISGDPGIGKSAIIAQLASKHPQVMAYHFCISSLADSLNPDVFVKSVAAQLATQIKEYYEAIKQINIEQLTRLDSGTLFRRLIADPLKSIELHEQVVILIDALDESWTDTGNNIVKVLHERIEDLPDTVKLVVSSRKIPDILDLLSKYKPHEIDPAYLENIHDITAYLDKKFSEGHIKEKIRSSEAVTPQIKNLIIRKSEGNFLYVKQFIHGIETDQIDINNAGSFPDGLIGIYITFFDRIFSKKEDYEEYRSILEVITCLKIPFSAKEISPIIQVSEFEIARKMQTLSAFFPERDGRYYPYHKSITDWLTGSAGRGRKYLLYTERGRKRVCDYLLQRYSQGSYSSYLLTYLPNHLIEAEKYSELIDLLLDFNFIIQKCSHKMVYELIKDYHAAFEVLPEFLDIKKDEREYAARMAEFTGHLISNSELIRNKGISIESVTPWNDRQIEDEIERIRSSPSKKDMLILFLQFLNAQSHLLFRYGSKPGYLIQQAYNHAGSGPFASYVDDYIKKCKVLKLLFTPEQREKFNPFNPCLRILQEHTERVHGLKMTPDGRFVISGSNDCTVKVWDTMTKECISDFQRHTSEVVCVDISMDGKTGVSGGYDNTLYFWDIPGRKCVHSFEGIEDLGYTVKLSSDNRILFSCCGYDDKTVKVAIKVWDLGSGNCIKTLYGHDYAINSLETTHDGKFLISASMDKTIKIWNLNNYCCIKTIEGHVGPVRSLKLTPDMKYIISGGGGGYDNTVRIWDIYQSTTAPEEPGLYRNLNHVLFSPSGNYILNSSRKILQLRDPGNGEILYELAGHKAHIKQVRINREGTRIISAGLDKTIRIWDPGLKECTGILEGHADGVLDFIVSKDEKKMISCGWDKQIIEWDLLNNKQVKTYQGHDNSVVDISYFSNEERILSIGANGMMKLWDASSAYCLETIQNEIPVTTSITLDSNDNLYLGYLDGSVQCRDLHNPEKILNLKGHTGSVSCLELVEDGNTLFSGSMDSTVRQWDLRTGDCIKVYKGHDREILFIRKVPGQNLIITASRDYTLRVWELYSNTCIAVLSTNLLISSLTPVERSGRFAYSTLQGEFKIIELSV